MASGGKQQPSPGPPDETPSKRAKTAEATPPPVALAFASSVGHLEHVVFNVWDFLDRHSEMALLLAGVAEHLHWRTARKLAEKLPVKTEWKATLQTAVDSNLDVAVSFLAQCERDRVWALEFCAAHSYYDYAWQFAFHEFALETDISVFKPLVDCRYFNALKFLLNDRRLGVFTCRYGSVFTAGALVPASIANELFKLSAVAFWVPGLSLLQSFVKLAEWELVCVAWKVLEATRRKARWARLRTPKQLREAAEEVHDAQCALDTLEIVWKQIPTGWASTAAAMLKDAALQDDDFSVWWLLEKHAPVAATTLHMAADHCAHAALEILCAHDGTATEDVEDVARASHSTDVLAVLLKSRHCISESTLNAALLNACRDGRCAAVELLVPKLRARKSTTYFLCAMAADDSGSDATKKALQNGWYDG